MLTTFIPMPGHKKKIILGIDPGLARTGFGIIEESAGRITAKSYGVIETKSTTEFPKRIGQIYKDIERLITKWRPDYIAIEELFFHRNVTTAFTVGQARGVVILAAYTAKLRIVSCTPLQVKRALTGYGKASKSQMQKLVANFLKLKKIPRPDDAADALAIAVCGLRLINSPIING